MYFRLTEALKRRFILELRRYWQYHPKYTDLPDHIQGKFSFRERPSTGIIVKTGSGNHVALSADNFMGTAESYLHLATVRDYPGTSIEWVREDEIAIQNNRGLFPSPAGIYFIELTEDTQFYVDPLLDVFNEILTPVDALTYSMQHHPIAGTIRVFEMPARYQLYEGINYTVPVDGQGQPTGEIVLLQPLTGDRYLVADYRYSTGSQGPFTINPGCADNTAIPGVVLAFGRRNQKGDRLAVVIDSIRRPAYLVYGGKWDMTLDFDVTARDVYAQQEIADQTVIYLWGVLRSRLSSEGMEISEISLGGESEEIFDENGDDYFYNSSFSLTIQTDWEVHVPLTAFLRQVSPQTHPYAQYLTTITDAQLRQANSTVKVVTDLGLELMRDPFFVGKIETFETIR